MPRIVNTFKITLPNNGMEKLNNFSRILSKYNRKFLHICNENVRFRQFCVDNKATQLNLLFFGNDNFSLNSLQSLVDARKKSAIIRNIDVVTSSSKKSNIITKYADENRLKCYHAITAEIILREQYDLGIVVSFGHLIAEDIINAFPRGMINVHASLLPRWRGAAPIIYAIMHGDKATGVSVMRILPKQFDIGEILAQRSVDIPPNVLMPELHERLSSLGAELLSECVLNLDASLENAKPQSDENVTYAPRIQSAISRIDWTKLSAESIRRRFRALYKFKELSTTFNNKEVRIIDIELESNPEPALCKAANSPIGSIQYIRSSKSLKVHCIDNDYIIIRKLQMKGKKIMTAPEFNCGFLMKTEVSERYFR